MTTPCGYRWLDSWIFRKRVPAYSNRAEWGPVFDQAALEAAVAAERKKFPNLQPVIDWLERGCDPKEAAKELRIYQREMRDA